PISARCPQVGGRADVRAHLGIGGMAGYRRGGSGAPAVDNHCRGAHEEQDQDGLESTEAGGHDDSPRILRITSSGLSEPGGAGAIPRAALYALGSGQGMTSGMQAPLGSGIALPGRKFPLGRLSVGAGLGVGALWTLFQWSIPAFSALLMDSRFHSAS